MGFALILIEANLFLKVNGCHVIFRKSIGEGFEQMERLFVILFL